MYFWDTVSIKEIDVTCHEEHDCIMLKCHILFVGNSIQLLPARIWVMNTWASVVWLLFFFFPFPTPLLPLLGIFLWICISLLNINPALILFTKSPFELYYNDYNYKSNDYITRVVFLLLLISLPLLNRENVAGQSKQDPCEATEQIIL